MKAFESTSKASHLRKRSPPPSSSASIGTATTVELATRRIQSDSVLVVVTMHGLSKRQEQVLDFIVERLATAAAPTHEEVAQEFGIGRRAVTEHVDALVTKGYLRRRAQHRSLEATDLAW